MKNTLPHQFTEGQVYSVRLPDSAYIEEWTVTGRKKAGLATGRQEWLILRDDWGNVAHRPIMNDGEREYIELHRQFHESFHERKVCDKTYITAGIHTINQ